MMARPPQVTRLLLAWNQGDDAALDELLPIVYGELRRLARSYMARERQGHTLQPTALINEVYLRLVDVRKVQWQNRAQFVAVCARLMRRILVDAARSRGSNKRGGQAQQIPFDERLAPQGGRQDELLAELRWLATIALAVGLMVVLMLVGSAVFSVLTIGGFFLKKTLRKFLKTNMILLI